jgi:hypothetical protein
MLWHLVFGQLVKWLQQGTYLLRTNLGNDDRVGSKSQPSPSTINAYTRVLERSV